jgi:hypothetical protein
MVTTTLQLKGLGRKAMTELAIKARRLGMSPERYLRELVREDLALDRKAKTTTLAEIMGPSREVDEAELDKLIDAARTRHHRRISKQKKVQH